MKVLLIGEYSSLHKYLKEGLKSIGVDVTLASGKDAWKKINGADLPFGEVNYHGLNLKTFYQYFIQPFRDAKKLKGYDVVQLISPRLVHPFINYFVCKMIVKKNRNLSLVAAGGDLAIVTAYERGLFDYYCFDYEKSTVNQYNKKTLTGIINTKTTKYLEDKANLIIPSLYEYSLCHQDQKVTKVIPFPINIDDIKYKTNIVKDRVVFFHGLNREKEKGTSFIVEALKKLEREYPDEVEVIIDGHMPFNEYLKVLEKTNVVIDQCLTYGYGINACISMAQGKIVMAPCRKETLDAFGIAQSPIIGIKPDVEYIYSQMVKILKNKEQIPQIGEASRKYVEDIHDYRKVAKQYYELWNSFCNY